MSLTVVEREAFQKVVQNFICKNQSLTKSQIVNHFVSLGRARSTIYSVLNKLTVDRSTTEKKRNGRHSSWTPQKRQRLKRLTNNRCDVSQRKLASKFDTSLSTICRQLSKLNIKHWKREKTPKYTPKKAKKARVLSRKLRNTLYSKKSLIIMDDEKYFRFSSTYNNGYYSTDKNNCPDSVRFLGEEKFPGMLLMWIAISERGISEPFFARTRSETITSELYISECLEKRLLPFILNKHRGTSYLFWPDLARAHTQRKRQ